VGQAQQHCEFKPRRLVSAVCVQHACFELVMCQVWLSSCFMHEDPHLLVCEWPWLLWSCHLSQHLLGRFCSCLLTQLLLPGTSPSTRSCMSIHLTHRQG